MKKLAILLTLVFGWSHLVLAQKKTDKPNVILIFTDSMFTVEGGVVNRGIPSPYRCARSAMAQYTRWIVERGIDDSRYAENPRVCHGLYREMAFRG